MRYSYLIVAEDESNAKSVQEMAENFPEFFTVGNAYNKEDALNAILEWRPQLVFLSLSQKPKSDLSLFLITELYRYITIQPQFVILYDNDKLAFEALKTGILDYLIRPVTMAELRKTLYKFQKLATALHLKHPLAVPEIIEEEGDNDTGEEKSVREIQKSDVDIQICIKSYGDYQFIALKDVLYLEADNNTTDFYLINGKKLSAYKTLKHYENNLPSFFYRIHNSYIVNSNYVSRINTGKQLCYLNNNEVSVSFSKTFKENVDTIIRKIAPEYL